MDRRENGRVERRLVRHRRRRSDRDAQARWHAGRDDVPVGRSGDRGVRPAILIFTGRGQDLVAASEPAPRRDEGAARLRVALRDAGRRARHDLARWTRAGVDECLLRGFRRRVETDRRNSRQRPCVRMLPDGGDDDRRGAARRIPRSLEPGDSRHPRRPRRGR